MLRYRPICWSRKKQAILVLSSTEVEYRGDLNATIQVVFPRGILTQFDMHTYPSVDIFCDSHIAIEIYSDPVQKSGSNNIEFRMHYIQDLVHSKDITLNYCPTEDKIENIFTNSFTKNIFVYIISLLGVKA